MGLIFVTFRRLVKEKYYSAVCILSLALGFSSSIVIGLFLYSELTYNHFHENHEQIYLVSTGIANIEIGYSGYEVGPVLVRDNPQLLDYVRFREGFETNFSYEENERTWDDVSLVDESVFEHFTFVSVAGQSSNAFDDLYSIAVSRRFAEFYFSNDDPIGKLVSTQNHEFRVNYVFENNPENVTQPYDVLLPYDLLEVYQPDYRENFSDRFIAPENRTYFTVSNSFDPAMIEGATARMFETYMADEYQNVAGEAPPLTLSLQALADIHFGRELIEVESGGNIFNIFIFAAVAGVLIIISCINYVNLATARAARRVREVAMRKILGASSKALVGQFVIESIVVVSLAFILATVIAILLISGGYVEAFTGKAELAGLLLSPERFPLLIAAGFIIALITGLYPAINLSRASMMSVLKPQQSSWRKGLPLRQLLVVLQMTASIIIVACVLVMLRQSSFLEETPLGFKRDNQLVVALRTADAIKSREAIMTELSRHVEINSVVEMSGAMGRSLSVSILPVENEQGVDESVTANSFRAGKDFLEALEIELRDGMMFGDLTRDVANNPLLVNETFVRQLQWSQPIGKMIGQGEVIGVINDFHYMPLHEPIGPLWVAPYNDGYLDALPPGESENASIDLVINTTGNNFAQTRDYVEEIVDEFSTQPIIEVVTMTEIWNDMYDDDSQTISLVGIFGAISIVISLLGVAGLAAYNAQQRAREIAIHKLLGASVASIVTMMSSSLARVLLFAALPALVLAYYLSGMWLERFAYRVDFSITPFLLAVIVVAICSGLILTALTLRSAQSNPVDKLKYE